MKEGEADSEHSNPVLLPLVPEFTTSAFLIYSCYTFKKFLLEVVAIGRKNAGCESDTPPLPIATASQKQLHSFCALFALSCPPLGKEEWGGGFCKEGEGGELEV
jgi:hypothetical protein